MRQSLALAPLAKVFVMDSPSPPSYQKQNFEARVKCMCRNPPIYVGVGRTAPRCKPTLGCVPHTLPDPSIFFLIFFRVRVKGCTLNVP
jgi:hypothetical protein